MHSYNIALVELRSNGSWGQSVTAGVALILKYNMDFKQNKMDFEGEVFISPPFFASIDCVKKDENKEFLPVDHFLWPHSQSTASQSFLIFAFHLKVSWEPEQLRSHS